MRFRQTAFLERAIRFYTSFLLLVLLVVTQFSFLAFLLPTFAEASEVTIASLTANRNATSHNLAGSQTVFISDQVGYKFYRAEPNAGPCVYQKTTDGGATWGAQVGVDSRTDCSSLAVWYDRWTPGDTGTNIHIVTMQVSAAIDHLFYNRLDTTGDSLLVPSNSTVNVSSNSGQVATLARGTNVPTITKSTGGGVFIAISDVSDSFVVSCTTTCNSSTNWNEVGTTPLPLANDWNLLAPLADGGVLLINRQLTAPRNIRSAVWNGSSWSGWNTIASNVVNNATYDVGMSITSDHATGDVLLAYASDNNNFTTANHDVRTARFSGGSSGSWTNTTDVFTNAAGRGLHNVAISIDENTSTVYVIYSIRTTINNTATGNVFWATSTTAMSTWGSEQGPVSTVSGNIYGMNVNLMSTERIYATWYDATVGRTIRGATIANLTPATRVSALGTQQAVVRGGQTAQYIGGTFVIEELDSSRNVTNITISEAGTIDANAHLKNIRLYYNFDTTAPYDCASESYSTSLQFGDTLAGGFSGADGVASFTDSVAISTSSSLCVYVSADILDTVTDGATIAYEISDPVADVLVSGGVDVIPRSPITFATDTLVVIDVSTQTAYHWRNDNGNEIDATSASAGVANTPLLAVQQNSPRRLRTAVANTGSTTTAPLSFNLEYGIVTTVCSDIVSWTPVNDPSAHFASYDSSFVTNGSDTTDIAIASGGVPSPNGTSTFKTPNFGQLDTTATSAATTLSPNEFIELEFSLEPTSNSVEGTTYCFRLTDAGTPLKSYTSYPQLTVSADVTLSSIGSMVATTIVGTTTAYLGGAFTLRENVSSRDVEEITITQTGTVDGTTGLENIRLVYKYDTTLPYDCSSETYTGTESSFGTTVTNFATPQGTATFTDSIAIATTSTMCLYVVVDVTEEASNGETIGFSIAGGASDIVVTSGSVAPSTAVALTASTTILGAEVFQFAYHWRNNNDNEVDATSATAGVENTELSDYLLETPIRLRLGIHNDGNANTPNRAYQLQYGIRLTTCSAIATWSDVDATNDWQPFDSGFLTHGNDTTNIPVGDGGITDPSGASFVASNAGIRTTSGASASVVLATDAFIEYEFSIVASSSASYETEYCFRLLDSADKELQYTSYPVLETAPKRDFRVQRGVINASVQDTVLTAGVDYIAPDATSSAYVRITNAHHTGAGQATGDVNQNAREISARINTSDITTSFTISRPPSATSNTRVYWELVEFIGPPGTDNEIIVRSQSELAMNSPDIVVNGPTISGIADDSKVVVYVTGITTNSASRNFYYAQQVTSEWDATNDRPVFRRGAASTVNLVISYAVVEYTGINWEVQRVEHTYTAAGSPEIESLEPVNSLNRTFTHIQKRMAAEANVQNFGHEVWLSSLGAVTFRLDSGATNPANHTSVAWVIENMQTSQGRMEVQRQGGTMLGGAAPIYQAVGISPVEATNNTSVSIVISHTGANTAFPRPLVGFTLSSTTALEIFRSRSGSTLTYRSEVVEWPTQGLALRQHYYRIYNDNDLLLPADPWPPGPVDLGENMAMTVLDEPIGLGDKIRLRMALRTDNANWPAGLYQFKLQYGALTSSCSAVSAWTDVGDASSGAIWRLYPVTGVSDGQALSTNPPTFGDLVLSVANRAGVISATTPTVTNPYTATVGDFVEFDWPIQHNGAVQKTSYCFRMIYSTNDPVDGYLFYPEIRTAGFTPATLAWRWYSDVANETPGTPLALDNVAPIEIANQTPLALRVTVDELKNVTGNNVKFSLQFDESPLFSSPQFVTASSSCTDFSRWCYADVPQTDNATITTAVLSASESCIASAGTGCGTHNTSPTASSTFTHTPESSREYAFYLESRTARVGAVYYFRLIDTDDGAPVRLADGASHPSLVSESALLSFTVDGLAAGTSTAGVTLTQTSTPSAIQFTDIPLDTIEYAGHRINVTTNASDGYRVYLRTTGPFGSSHGGELQPVSGTNAGPVAWATGCELSALSCVGYHTTDATLSGTSSRFAALDTYAQLSSTLDEIIYSPIPANETHDVVFGLLVRAMQPAGNYETNLIYIASPIY